jgi:hypothetical protein
VLTGPPATAGRPLPDPEPWTPPVSVEEHVRLVGRLRTWEPLDGALLDDASDALDEVPPGRERLEEITQRLAGRLRQLVDLATAHGAEEKSPYIGVLLTRAREALTEALTGALTEAADGDAVRAARRMGWLASELLEELTAARCVKGVA